MDDNFFLEIRRKLEERPSNAFTKLFIRWIDEYCLKNTNASTYSHPQDNPQPVPQPIEQVDEIKEVKEEKPVQKEYTKAEIEAFHQSMPGAKMIVEDVFTILGKGTVATGKVKNHIKVGDTINIIKPSGDSVSTAVQSIEINRQIVEEATPGDNIGLVLRGIQREDVSRYDVII